MSIKDKAYRLYEYISQVYSIDLPVNRDITNYRAELWWQSDLIPCEQFKIKEFCSGNNNIESENETETSEEDAWLSVIKRSYEGPPEPPYILKNWLDLSSEPTKKPTPKSSITKPVDFQEDDLRVVTFNDYITFWHQWRKNPKSGLLPVIPEILSEWIDKTVPEHLPPMYKHERVIEQRFEDDKNRISAFEDYINGPWRAWAERVLPLFKAHILYDELFTLYQRLSIEGDRVEILWGHLFLAWKHDQNDTVCHPLMLTPINLIFDPQRRKITLIPSQTIPTKLDLDCLLNLDYPLKDELIRFALNVNNAESTPEVWNHNQMRGLASTITGFISKETAEETNKYYEEPISKPDITSTPTIYNAPVIFVRDRTRRLWIEDAKKIAESIYNGEEIPPFIRALVADPRTNELPNPDNYIDTDNIDEDEAEPLLPLEYNDQQKEIAEKLKRHYGVLVQGPPVTGKSHTIANIISSLLSRGKRVLVTSQTENALKVLRNYIPKEIRSLCVSNLGNDLVAWANAMRRYGAGTGRHAQRYLSEAAKAMVDAVGSVPSWIMPLHRVVQSFPAKHGVFDVIITDEASQCDLRALSVLFRAKKVLVVGDPEQISPANVGIERDKVKVFELINQYLSDIPHPLTFTIDNSLYEITKAIPRMNRTLLTEHFRCVPQIIEFNNRLCPTYEGRLEPLRQPNPQERLEPVINTIFLRMVLRMTMISMNQRLKPLSRC